MKLKQTSASMYLILLLILSAQAHHLCAVNTPQRNCIILLDHNDNDNVGRAVWFLMSRIQSAIAEQSTPLLISTSLWNSFIERRINFKQKLERNNNPLHKIYNLYQTINERIEYWSRHYNALSHDAIQNKKLVVERINKEFYHNKTTISPANYQLLLNHFTHFDPQDWDIYKNNGGFYLLVPKKYSDQNTSTGFNLNALEKVADPEDSSYMYFESHTKQSIINSLPDFFLTYDDLTDMPYAWNIILAGHGGSRYKETNNDTTVTWTGEPCISNLNVQEFKSMLEFFQSKVKTNLFHYASCYAGGNHVSLIFNEIQQKPYNFAVICDNLTDCAAYCKWTTLLPSDEKKFLTTADLSYDHIKNCWYLPLTPVYHWADFFKAIASIDFSIDSIEYLEEAMSLITYPMIANIPLLCPPETSTFFPLQPLDTIKIDDQLLAMAQKEDDCITLNEVKTVLMESPIVIPTIVLNHTEPLRIVSIKPGDAIHYIKKLKSPHYIDLPSAFWQAQYQLYNKTFILDECSFSYSYDFKTILPQKNQLILKNVIISQKQYQLIRICFTLNDKAMMVIAHKPIEEDEKATIQECVTMTDAAQKKYEEYYSSLKSAVLNQNIN